MAKAEKPAKEVEEKKVRVISMRPGNIVLQDGHCLKHLEVIEVSEECAVWLEASFKEFIKRV